MKNCIKEWEEELTKSIKGFDITFDKYDLIKSKLEGAKQREKEILEVLEKVEGKLMKPETVINKALVSFLEDLIKEIKEE